MKLFIRCLFLSFLIVTPLYIKPIYIVKCFPRTYENIEVAIDSKTVFLVGPGAETLLESFPYEN